MHRVVLQLVHRRRLMLLLLLQWLRVYLVVLLVRWERCVFVSA